MDEERLGEMDEEEMDEERLGEMDEEEMDEERWGRDGLGEREGG